MNCNHLLPDFLSHYYDTLAELPALIVAYGLLQVWDSEGKSGPDRYIEARRFQSQDRTWVCHSRLRGNLSSHSREWMPTKEDMTGAERLWNHPVYRSANMG